MELIGPFPAGPCGVTAKRIAGRIEWRTGSATAESEAVLDVPGIGWPHTYPQRVSLCGEHPAFETGIPGGMNKLCEAMAKAGVNAEP